MSREHRETGGSQSALAGQMGGWVNRAPQGSTPPDYFAFRSAGILPREVRDIVGKHGRNTLIGIDSTNDRSKFDATAKAARDAGARLHVYVEGPGGETGHSGISDDEMGRMREAGRKQGIDVDTKAGMRRWNQVGWKVHTRDQLQQYKKQGFESAEIDNLDRAGGRLLDFYNEYNGWWQNGEVPRLMMKNLSPEQMKGVAQAVEAGTLPRGMFSDFHISEFGTGDRTQQG